MSGRRTGHLPRLHGLLPGFIGACLLLATPGLAPAAGPRGAAKSVTTAQDLFHRAMAHKRAEEYDLAVRDFTEAYRLSPRPNFLYLIGETQKEADHVPEAIAAYHRYLEVSPDAPDRQLVLDQLDALLQQPLVPTPTVKLPPPGPRGPALAPYPPTSQAAAGLPPPADLSAWTRGQGEHRAPVYPSWWRRPWLWIGVGAAVGVGVAIGVGVALRPTEQTFAVAPGGLP